MEKEKTEAQKELRMKAVDWFFAKTSDENRRSSGRDNS